MMDVSAVSDLGVIKIGDQSCLDKVLLVFPRQISGEEDLPGGCLSEVMKNGKWRGSGYLWGICVLDA